MTATDLVGRTYIRPYVVARRSEVHGFLLDGVKASGGDLLFSTGPSVAPTFLTIGRDRAVEGAVCYMFRCNPAPIAGRPPDEHRLQVRYGGQASWERDEHRLAADPAGADAVLVMGAHVELGLFVGLGTRRYNPLPMGISVEFKEVELLAARSKGWHTWTRGKAARPEVLIAFVPEMLLEFVAFERAAAQTGQSSARRLALAASWLAEA